jgi:hypothetical protein
MAKIFLCQKLKFFIKLKKLNISKRDPKNPKKIPEFNQYIVKNGLVQKEKYRDTYNGFTTDL